jgi:DNA processing protein
LAHIKHLPLKTDGIKTAADSISYDERLARLRLIRSENVGAITYHALVGEYGSAGAALEALPELARRGGQRSYRICPVEAAEMEIAAADEFGARLVAMEEAEFPPLLLQIEPPPPLVYMKGTLDLLRRPAIAIVGSRNASAAGQTLANSLACDLGASGLLVVSGLARGIDTAAHWGSLAAGTVAVVAGGIDVLYPPENRKLYDAIAEQGILLSEMPMNFQPRGQEFPRRNRLISGLSLGAVVVEAALQSGSLITSRFALEQNREVFAVPGHPLDPRAAGTNALIVQGATLVRGAEDVLAALSRQIEHYKMRGFYEPGDEFLGPGRTSRPPSIVGEAERDTVLSSLSATGVSVDEIITVTGLDARQVNIALMELDLAGKIDRQGQGRVALALAQNNIQLSG